MKNMPMRLIGALALVLMVVFNSCKEDDGVITPVFPELKETSGQPGDTLEIAFNANLDWSILSSKGWCKFVNGEFPEITASGKAGEQSLKVAISNTDWNYQTNDEAELKLTMMDMSQVIYKVTRAKKEYQNLTITDEAGNVYNAQNRLTIKGSGLRDVVADSVYTIVKASADMQVGLISYPNWLYAQNMGDGVFRFIFDKGKQDIHGKDPIFSFDGEENDKIVFATKDYIDGNVETDKIRMVEVPVDYEGLKDNYVEFEDNYEGGRYPTELYVSIDGSSFASKIMNGMTGQMEKGESFYGPLETNITARNNEYHVFIVSQSKEVAPNRYEYSTYDFEKNVDWIEPGILGTSLDLYIHGLGDENRGALVLVFSKDHWDAIQSDSISKYGSLEQALMYKELIYKPDLGNDENGDPIPVPDEQCIYTMSLKGDYTGNVWVNLFQEKEQTETEGLNFEAYGYMNLGDEPMFMTFEEIIGQGIGIKPTITNISGTDEAANEFGISNVWKITCPNMMLVDENTCLAIQTNGLVEGQQLGAMETPEGVTFGSVEKDGKQLFTVKAPEYQGTIGLIVGDSAGKFYAYLIIEVTAQ